VTGFAAIVHEDAVLQIIVSDHHIKSLSALRTEQLTKVEDDGKGRYS